MKKIAILTVIFIGCIVTVEAQVDNSTTSPAYDNVHHEHIMDKKMMHNTKYALIKNDYAVPRCNNSVFRDYPDLNSHKIITFPNREEYIKDVHLHNYIKSDLK